MCSVISNWLFGSSREKVTYRRLGYHAEGEDPKIFTIESEAVAPAVIPDNMNRQDRGRLTKLNEKIKAYNKCIEIVHTQSTENDRGANHLIQKWHSATHAVDRKTCETLLIGKLKYRQDYQQSLCTYYQLVDKCKHYTSIILCINELKRGTKAKLDNNIPGDIDGLEESLAQELDAFLESDTASKSLHNNMSAKIAQESPETDADIKIELKQLLQNQDPTVDLLRAQFAPIEMPFPTVPDQAVGDFSESSNPNPVTVQPQQATELMSVSW